MRKVGPLSVLKFSLVFYFCVMLIIYLALLIIWVVLSAAGGIDALARLLGQVFPANATTGEAPPLQIDGQQVFTWLFVMGVVSALVWSVINVFVAFLYNLISDLVGRRRGDARREAFALSGSPRPVRLTVHGRAPRLAAGIMPSQGL